MKKLWRFGMTVLMTAALMLGGCGSSGDEAGKEDEIPLLDGENYNCYSWGFHRILKGENGYYYLGNRSGFEFHYYDEESGKSVYLCSRPECLHDGNELCTATNSEYSVIDCIEYGGKLYCSAVRYDKEDSATVVLLRIEPDGSGLTELVVLKESGGALYGTQKADIFIHRGIVFADYAFMTEDKDTQGTVVYNLVDGTKTELPEYTFERSLDGYHFDVTRPRFHYMASENYVYYNEYRPKDSRKNKLVLCRYDITTGEVKEAATEGVYKGVYTVTETNKMVYADKFGNLYKYDFDTDKLESFGKLQVPIIAENPDGTHFLDFHFTVPAGVGDFLYYKGKLYALLDSSFHQGDYVLNVDEEVQYSRSMVKLDENLQIELDEKQSPEKSFLPNPLAVEEIRHFVLGQEETGEFMWVVASVSVIGNNLYIQGDNGVARMDLDDYLAGDMSNYKLLMDYGPKFIVSM